MRLLEALRCDVFHHSSGVVVVLGSRKIIDPKIWWETVAMTVEVQCECFACVERAI